MSLEGKQPLITLELSLDLQEVNRAGIPVETLVGLSDKITEKVKDTLILIHPDLTIIDVARSAARLTSFECNPPGTPTINAIFQGYVK